MREEERRRKSERMMYPLECRFKERRDAKGEERIREEKQKKEGMNNRGKGEGENSTEDMRTET